MSYIFFQQRLQKRSPSAQFNFAQQSVALPVLPIQNRFVQSPAATWNLPTPSSYNLADDTRVNDLITSNGNRGSLLRIDPDSELIRINPKNGLVDPVRYDLSNLSWTQERV